ncbi:acetoacetate--CoA ligase (plasmid) [Rhodococcus qingshengii]|uniref:acetoacetate--CoA ligase n=1 Tax=Rhodococcus qingshengii TaxID=334542 RepID=UPI0021112901|nr:acetoacetate--CoA ligase [Rhodococcus qingshengii]UUE28694.1 acetoacetate--CoA ligase [Rhodococcus qingshengii]
MTTDYTTPITRVRHVGIGVPNYAESREFYRNKWGLEIVEEDSDVAFFGTPAHPEQYIVRVRKSAEKRLDLISFAVDNDSDVDALAERLAVGGAVKLEREPGQLDTPGGGYGFRFFDPDGRLLEVSSSVAEREYRALEPAESIPQKLSHVVINSTDVSATKSFYEQHLGFKLSDWLEDQMCFMRVRSDHHILAIGRGPHVSLNHISFEMRGLDEFMRGTGRMMRAGTDPIWGPGRHSAGDNTFSYFFDRTADAITIDTAFPTVRTTVTVSLIEDAEWPEPATAHDFVCWSAAVKSTDAELSFTPVPFDHPLWVLFSSETTGKPKGIVHGHGGVLLNHHVLVGQHLDVGRGDRFTWYSSTNWMMWNIVVSGLITGATIVVYDGNPSFPHMDRFWELCADAAITVTGTSPAYLRACEEAGEIPRSTHDPSALRTIGVTGSPVPNSSFDWVRDAIGPDVQLASSSGGTDVVSAFAAANPLTPIWGAELSAPCLGVALEAWNTGGSPVHGQVGELVITKPIPSMPVALWGDADRSRLHDTYFSTYPGVWRHGDWITLTDRGGILIHGRSDATLNRKGVRIGSAEIYEAVEQLADITEALVIGLEIDDARYWMPMFVTLAPGVVMTPTLHQAVVTAIATATSRRHVPDDIIVVDAIPHTTTGKKLEVPIKRILLGANPDDVINPQLSTTPTQCVRFSNSP